MKVLIVGGGGREHAFAWRLRLEDPQLEVIAAPGNAGLAEHARCVPVAATNLDALLALAEAERPALTVVGPEAPLALGIVDRFRQHRLPIFGPPKAAAQIESSKVFAKELMIDAGVPTARAERHTDPNAARRAARDFGLPVVIKASGLAAGKGVIVAETAREADEAIDAMLTHHRFGAAGAEILVEEHMRGEELSLHFLTNGTQWVPFVAAQDHKRLLDGDQGPNTGGMGAYAPVHPVPSSGPESAATGTDVRPGTSPRVTSLVQTVADRIVEPTLAALRERGSPFTGVLYAGLMLTDDGPRVVEFNCRMGDPEAQAILPLTRFDILRLDARSSRGRRAAPHWVGVGESTIGGGDGRRGSRIPRTSENRGRNPSAPRDGWHPRISRGHGTERGRRVGDGRRSGPRCDGRRVRFGGRAACERRFCCSRGVRRKALPDGHRVA